MCTQIACICHHTNTHLGQIKEKKTAAVVRTEFLRVNEGYFCTIQFFRLPGPLRKLLKTPLHTQDICKASRATCQVACKKWETPCVWKGWLRIRIRIKIMVNGFVIHKNRCPLSPHGYKVDTVHTVDPTSLNPALVFLTVVVSQYLMWCWATHFSSTLKGSTFVF